MLNGFQLTRQAQLAEHRNTNPEVTGSNPVLVYLSLLKPSRFFLVLPKKIHVPSQFSCGLVVFFMNVHRQHFVLCKGPSAPTPK